MAANPGGVPSINSPLVDQGGTLSQPWYQYFVGIRQRIDFDTAPPTRGAWQVPWVRFNSAPAVGQPKGWVLTVSGTPGTWISQGNL